MELICLLLVLLLPLLSAGMIHFFASEKNAGWISTALLAATLVSAIFLVAKGPATMQWSFTWWQVGALNLEVQLRLSPFVTLMVAVVALVSLAVHLFSISYITQSSKRYFATLGLFTCSMMGVLASDHLVVLFCFWELMGICSYLLIGFWREKSGAAAAATKAFLINRVGDAALLAAILILYADRGTFQISALVTAPPDATHGVLPGMLFFAAFAAKSAQWPLHSWLPDAMEGPTPVSALIHAATMVAAGVVLYARVYPLLISEVHIVICLLSLLSACMGGYQALLAHDLKKILAYSTVSQLGLMIAAVAVGAAGAGLLHLLAHAFFKAGLFLAAGLIIHHYRQHQPENDPQDLRFMGGLGKSTRLFFVFLVLIGALAGIPFSSGFLSKENMLAAMFAYADERATVLPWFFITLFFAATFLTVMYSWRLVSAIFLDAGIAAKPTVKMNQWLATCVLAGGSGWYVISAHPADSNGWLANWMQAPGFNASWLLAAGSVAWIACAWWVARISLSNKQYRFAKPLQPIDTVYRAGVVRPVLVAALAAHRLDTRVLDGLLRGIVVLKVSLAHLVSWLDNTIIDGVVHNVGWLLVAGGNLIRKPARGEVQRYLAWATLGMIIFLFWILN